MSDYSEFVRKIKGIWEAKAKGKVWDSPWEEKSPGLKGPVFGVVTLQELETLFHEVRKQNDVEEMVFSVHLLSRYLEEFRKEKDAEKCTNQTEIFRSIFRGFSIPDQLTGILAVSLRDWGKGVSSRPSLYSPIKENHLLYINLALNIGVLYADLDTGLIAPGPRFPSDFGNFEKFLLSAIEYETETMERLRRAPVLL